MNQPTMKTVDIFIKEGRARKNFDPEKLVELANSFKTVGIIEPLVVTHEGEKVVLVAGERRMRAALIAGLKEVPVIFKTVDRDGKIEGLSNYEQRLIELHENVGRQDLSLIEEAFLIREIHQLQQTKHGISGKGQTGGWRSDDTGKLLGVTGRKVRTHVDLANKIESRPDLFTEEIKKLPLAAMLQKVEQIETTERVERLRASGQIKTSTEFRLGDCLDLIKEVTSNSIDCVITDAPFGIPNLEGNRGDQQIYTSFLKETDNLDEIKVYFLIQNLIPELHRVMKDGGHLWIFYGWELFSDTRNLLSQAGFDVVGFPVIWKKNKITVSFKGYEPSPCYEQIILAHKGKRSRRLRDSMKSIIEFDTISNTIRTHPFEKPSLLLEFLINQSTQAGETILDPFAGTASTLRVATQMGRSAIGFEIDKDHWSKGQELLHEEEKRRMK